MRTAKLVKIIKEIGKERLNNNMVLVLNERQRHGVTAADQIRANLSSTAAADALPDSPPAAAVAQRNKPGSARGSAADQFYASVAANKAAAPVGVSPTTVGVATTAAIAAKTAAKTAAPAVAGASKMLGRVIPGVGLALGAKDSYDRFMQGDYAGAALSAGAGVAGLVPGLGTAVSIGLTAAQIARDKERTGSFFASDEEKQAAVAKDNSKAAADAKQRLANSTPEAAIKTAAAGTQPGAPAPKPVQSIPNTPGSRPNPITGRIDTRLPPANSQTDAPIAGVGKQPNADAPGEEPGAQTGPEPPAAPPAAPARPAAPAPAAPAPRPQAPPPARPEAPVAPPPARPEAPKQDNITRSPFGGVTVNSKNSSSYDISLEEYTRSQKRVNMRTTKLIEMIKEIGKKRIDENRSRYSRTKTHLSMAGRYNRGQQLAQESNPGKTMTGKPADTIEMSPVANTTKLDR